MISSEDQVRIDVRSVLSDEEQTELCGRLREPRARARLIEGNTSFVKMVASEYVGRGLPLPDLIQEGNLGLIRAADRFDPTRGCKFITYAIWWIRQAIRLALAEQSRVVRVPVSRQQRYAAIQDRVWLRAQEQLELPARDEVVREFCGDAEKVTIVRTDRIAGEDDRGESLTASLPALDSNPLVDLEEEERAVFVAELLKCLKPRHARLIRMRFGLEDDQPLVLREIGERLGISRERARQLEQDALRSLRSLVSVAANEI